MASVGTLLSVLLVNVLSCPVSSLYFHTGDTERTCFIEDIPEDTVVIGNFRTQLYDERRGEYLPPTEDLAMFVAAKDPDEQLVLSRPFGSEGKFVFTSRKPGGYQICLRSSSARRPLSAGDVLAVHLDLRHGERTNNYTEIHLRDRLTELQLRVWQLIEQVLQILEEQNYQRVREKHFREVNHNTLMWIFWWPVVRSLCVVAIVIWTTKSW